MSVGKFHMCTANVKELENFSDDQRKLSLTNEALKKMVNSLMSQGKVSWEHDELFH